MIEGHSHDPTRYNNPTKGLQYDITSGEVSHDTIVMANLVRIHLGILLFTRFRDNSMVEKLCRSFDFSVICNAISWLKT